MADFADEIRKMADEIFYKKLTVDVMKLARDARIFALEQAKTNGAFSIGDEKVWLTFAVCWLCLHEALMQQKIGPADNADQKSTLPK